MIERIVIRGYRIFENLDFTPQPGMNIVVGDNEAGKSTLLETVNLALTGKVNGKWARDELNPYWFNLRAVTKFFADRSTDATIAKPEILIELYLTNKNDDLQRMRGVNNSRQDDCPGLRIAITPSPDYEEEFEQYLAAEDRPDIIPVEYYDVDWRDFSGELITKRPKELGVSFIDTRTIRSTSGVDYHTREMLSGFVEPKERAAISVEHRKARHAITREALGTVNKRIAQQGEALHDRPIGLQMDQSANASWEASIVPQVAEVPFAVAGQGQQAAIKVALAMSRTAERTAYVLIEEPENHLSHTSLTRLLARIEQTAGGRQIFVTTHSSYVLNRLGLDKLALLHKGTCAAFGDLPADTVRYFKKLSGFDTLRLVLAKSVVLVEGPSDEILFERAFADKRDGATPIDKGIDVVSMRGVALKRTIQLCAALDRRVAALRDNDGKTAEHWTSQLSEYLETGKREVFIGDPGLGHTLEPQLGHANEIETLRTVLELDIGDDVVEWMTEHKTEAALRLAEAAPAINYPRYMLDAIEFIG
jgi:putative ATP-dependent endonuclease of the OLD family